MGKENDEGTVEIFIRLKPRENLKEMLPLIEALEKLTVYFRDILEEDRKKEMREKPREVPSRKEKPPEKSRREEERIRIADDKNKVLEFLEKIGCHERDIDSITQKVFRNYKKRKGRPYIYSLEGKIKFWLLKEAVGFKSFSQCYNFLDQDRKIAKEIGLSEFPKYITLMDFIRRWKKLILQDIQDMAEKIRKEKRERYKKREELKEKTGERIRIRDEEILRRIIKKRRSFETIEKRVKKVPNYRKFRVYPFLAKAKALVFMELKEFSSYQQLAGYLLEHQEIAKKLGFSIIPTGQVFYKFEQRWGDYIQEDLKSISKAIRMDLRQEEKIKTRVREMYHIAGRKENVRKEILEMVSKMNGALPHNKMPLDQIILTIAVIKAANPVINGKDREIFEFLKEEGSIPEGVTLNRIARVKLIIKDLGLVKKFREVVSEIAYQFEGEKKKTRMKEFKRESEIKSIKVDPQARQIIWDLFNEKEKESSDILKIIRLKFQLDISEDDINEIIKEEIEKRGGRRCWQCDDFLKNPRKKGWGWCNIRRKYVRREQYICEKMI